MGIQKNGMKLTHQAIDTFDGGYNMMNWGNAYIRTSAQEWLLNNGKLNSDFTIKNLGQLGNQWPSKEYFPTAGANHKSIDMNGKDDSLVIDLRLPISDNDKHNIINWADVILDSGTSEHVSVQYYNWKNLYDICKVGGYMVHILPKVGYWENHCEFKYSINFFTELADKLNYKVVELTEDIPDGVRGDVLCILQKQSDNGFISELEFSKLPIYKEPKKGKDLVLYPYAYK